MQPSPSITRSGHNTHIDGNAGTERPGRPAPCGSPRRPAAAALALCAGLLLALPGVAAGQSRFNADVQKNPKPNNHRSIVEDHNEKLVATDRKYVDDVRGNWPGFGAAVDVVMQQCHSGGFAEPFEAASKAGVAGNRLANITFVSAVSYNNLADNDQEPADTEDPARIKLLDNFTRAWVADARLNTNFRVGFFGRWALSGLVGRNSANAFGVAPDNFPAISGIWQDPFTRGGRIRLLAADRADDPQYFSPDPLGVSGLPIEGPNNTRQYRATNQYAILVAWGEPNGRHAVNIVRMYRMLRDKYNIPVNNIVVLYGDMASGTRLPRLTTVGPGRQDLKSAVGVYVDGANTRANWVTAVQGGYFTFGNAPNANSRLFIYNTGHGDEKTTLTKELRSMDGFVSYTIDGFNKAQDMGLLPDGSGLVGVTDIDGTDLLQITTRRALTPLPGQQVQVRIDGNLIPAQLVEVSTPVAIDYDDPELVPEAGLRYYQVRFSHTLLNAAERLTRVEIGNMDDPDSQGDLVAGVAIQGGEQGVIGVVQSAADPDLCLSAAEVGEGEWAFDITDATTDTIASCGDGGAHDTWLRYTATQTGIATISTCDRAAFDTMLTIYDSCGGNELACNDDACGQQSTLALDVIAGSSYAIRIAGYGQESGPGLVNISVSPSSCMVMPAGAILENEPCGGPNINSGCATPAKTYTDVPGNAGVFFGSSFSTPTARDTDWYRLVLTEQRVVSATLQAEFAGRVIFLNNNCPAAILQQAFIRTRCQDTAGVEATLDPGTYYAYVASPGFGGNPCGVGGEGNNYILTIANHEVIAPPPDCPADFNESGAVTVQDIFDFLAAYFGGAGNADFNHSGTITVQDLFDFLAAYFTPCV